MKPSVSLPEEFEDHRDRHWRREETRRVETAEEAEQFIEQVGFAACLTDSRRPGPSLYGAVCGRRDAVLPRHVQKDPEAALTWTLKDELLRRGRVYYAKLARGKAMFIAPRLVPNFHALWGVRSADEARRLSRDARAILRVLRREWEMATSDLRTDAGIRDRRRFTKALDELQAAMLVIPAEAVYDPTFTYIWTLAVGRFGKALTRRMTRDSAVREIARAFLASAGMTIPGELARVVGVTRPEAGLANSGACRRRVRGDAGARLLSSGRGPQDDARVTAADFAPYKRKPAVIFTTAGLVEIMPAATYSPTQFPMQYHRRYEA